MRRRVFGMLLAVFLVASPAWAVTFTNVYDPEPDILLNFGGSGGVLGHDYTHDLTVFPGSATNPATGATSAFALSPALFSITSATLDLVLYDDADAAAESVQVTIDGQLIGIFNVITGSTEAQPTLISVPVPLALLSDGKLSVELDRSLNDMSFERSTLTVEANVVETPPDPGPGTAPVPFPATLILVGAGLTLAAALGGRRK